MDDELTERARGRVGLVVDEGRIGEAVAVAGSVVGGAALVFAECRNAQRASLKVQRPMVFAGCRSRACSSALIALTLLLGGVRSARAESSEHAAGEVANGDRQRAEDLYKEGTLLLGNGRYLEAEARFQASFKLLRGRGTLLNLAICHENLGKFATAWRELKSLAEQAAAAGDTTREGAAHEHLAWIEPQLSYLNVSLSTEARVPGVQVEFDGEPVPRFDAPFPVDSGQHQLRASAPGKKAWTIELVFQNGEQLQKSVTIPSLADEELAPLVAQLPPVASPKAAAPAVQPPPKPVARADYAGAYIAGTATLTLTVGAFVSSFLYYDRRSAYHDAVTHPGSVSDGEQSARRASAEQMAWINGTLIVGAGVGAALTGLLWYRASQAKVRVAEGAWVAPLVVGSGAGLRAGASF